MWRKVSLITDYKGNQGYNFLQENFLEEGKFIVGGASVACIVSQHCPWEYCSRLLVLPDTSMFSIFS